MRRSRQQLRILHVVAGLAPRLGGPAQAVPEMCSALVSRGHYVEVMTTNVDGVGALDVRLGVPLPLDGAFVTYFPVQWPRSYLVSAPLGRALWRRVPSFDVVHIHSLFRFHSAVTAWAAQRHQVPYVMRPHGTLDRYQREQRRGRKAVYSALIERRNLAHAAAIHYTSEVERQHAEEAGVRAPPYVIPLGVREPCLRLADPEAFFPELAGRDVITFLGRIAAKKGLDVLCEAFALVAARNDRVHLAVAGPDDDGLGRTAQRRLADLDLSGRASFLGLVRGERKAALLQLSRAFALPSLDENFAVAAVEAMAAGIPVIVTPAVAIYEEVERAGAGLVVQREPGEVARAINELIMNPEQARRMGDAGRAVAQNYSWESIAEKLEDMYYTLAQSTGARAQSA